MTWDSLHFFFFLQTNVVTPFLRTVQCSVQLLQCSTIREKCFFFKEAIFKIGFLNFSKMVSNFWKLSTVQCSAQLVQCSTIEKNYVFQTGGGATLKIGFLVLFRKRFQIFENSQRFNAVQN